jgi:hypothetical protein
LTNAKVIRVGEKREKRKIKRKKGGKNTDEDGEEVTHETVFKRAHKRRRKTTSTRVNKVGTPTSILIELLRSG